MGMEAISNRAKIRGFACFSGEELLYSHMSTMQCLMEAIGKTYEAPTSTVVELKFEGIICQSNGMGNRDPYTPTDENPFGYDV